MNVLQVVIGIFVFIECLNIIILYTMPGSKIGNGVGVFDAFHKTQEDEEIKLFVGYLINWVAGAKLIFIMMGIVVIVFGSEQVHMFSAVALVLSILSFYWRLFPVIKKLDAQGEISPKGYSKTLNIMILSFVILFAGALAIYFF